MERRQSETTSQIKEFESLHLVGELIVSKYVAVSINNWLQDILVM